MNKLVLMIAILQKKYTEEATSLLTEAGVSMTLGRYAKGTATNEISEVLMPDKEKSILFSTLPYNLSKKVMTNLISKCSHDGMCFTIPISSVGGGTVFEYLSGKVNIEEGVNMENDMPIKIENELIIAITKRGYTDLVMDVARKAGAGGGTVIHARGTGVEMAEKLFGSMVGAEKEMIFIAVEKKDKANIINSIMEKAGIDSEAQTYIFTLPIIDIVK